MSEISKLEQERRSGKLTQSQFESRRARILLNEQHAADAEAKARKQRDQRGMPLGAACCDRLLFGAGSTSASHHRLHDPLLSGGL